LRIHPIQHDVQSHNDPQMSLDYHLVDPLGDDEKDVQLLIVLDGCWSWGLRLKSWTRSGKSCQQLANPSNPAWHPKPYNDSQISLDYHLRDPLRDDEKDEQLLIMLDGCWSGGFRLKSWTRSS
jgi:hypothetical protein